jgi:hypothetical protein
MALLIWVTGHCNRAAISRNRYGVEKTVDTHKILINAIKFYVRLQERYFVIKLHTWFCLSYFLKTNIQLYCIYQYFMSINNFFNTVSVSRYSRPITVIYSFVWFWNIVDHWFKQEKKEKKGGKFYFYKKKIMDTRVLDFFLLKTNPGLSFLLKVQSCVFISNFHHSPSSPPKRYKIVSLK